MEIKFSEIPTAEAIAAMTAEEKQAAIESLEAATLDKATVYKITEMNRVRMQERFDKFYEEFQEQHKALIHNLNDAKIHAASEHEFLQQAAVARRLLTGDKTWKAFQAAEVLKPQYDPMGMLVWALNDAPGDVRYELIQLNTKAADKLILDRADENGVPKVYEGSRPLPALVMKTYTGKVLTKELQALLINPPTPETKLVEPVGEPISIQVAQPNITYLLTKDEVASQVAGDDPLDAIEKDLIRLSETPTPVDPIPAVEIDEIPF